MVLEKIRKLVIQEDRWSKVCWDIKFDDTLFLCGDVSDGAIVGIIYEGVARRIWLGGVRICSTESVWKFVWWNVRERQIITCRRRCEILAVGVVKWYLGNKGRSPYEKATDGRKYNANDEERWENRFGRKYGLPCFEPLLLECSVYRSYVRYWAKNRGNNDKLAGRLQLPFSFLFSEESAESESCLFFLLKRPMTVSMWEPNPVLTSVYVSSDGVSPRKSSAPANNNTRPLCRQKGHIRPSADTSN